MYYFKKKNIILIIIKLCMRKKFFLTFIIVTIHIFLTMNRMIFSGTELRLITKYNNNIKTYKKKNPID